MNGSPVTPSRRVIVLPGRVIGSRIAKMFAAQQNQWQTIEGIAEATNLSPAYVRYYIQAHPDEFKRSPISVGGIPLYALKKESPGDIGLQRRKNYVLKSSSHVK